MEFYKGFALLAMAAAFCGVSRVDAYPAGAPATQCGPMAPGHGVTAQNSLAPYTVTTDSQYYMPGQMRTSE